MISVPGLWLGTEQTSRKHTVLLLLFSVLTRDFGTSTFIWEITKETAVLQLQMAAAAAWLTQHRADSDHTCRGQRTREKGDPGVSGE